MFYQGGRFPGGVHVESGVQISTRDYHVTPDKPSTQTQQVTSGIGRTITTDGPWRGLDTDYGQGFFTDCGMEISGDMTSYRMVGTRGKLCIIITTTIRWLPLPHVS